MGDDAPVCETCGCDNARVCDVCGCDDVCVLLNEGIMVRVFVN